MVNDRESSGLRSELSFDILSQKISQNIHKIITFL